MKIPLAVELLPQGAMLGCCRLLITRERGRSSCFGPNCGSSIGPTATAHQQEKEQDQRTSHRGNKTTFSHRGTLGISHQVHPQTLRIDLRAQRYLFAKNRQNRVERYKQTILFLGVCGIIVQKTAKVPRKHSP